MILESGLALLDERLRRFLVIEGLARTRMVDRLGVEQRLKVRLEQRRPAGGGRRFADDATGQVLQARAAR